MRHYGLQKKGLIFALDAALAVTVVVLMVINSTYYFSIASKGSLSHLQSVKTASDIMTVLDYVGSLDNVVLNDSTMEAGITYTISASLLNLSYFLPTNYVMWVSISDLRETLLTPFTISGPTAGCFDSDIIVYFADSIPLERSVTAYLQFNVSVKSGGGFLDVYINLGQLKKVEVTKDGIYTIGPFTFNKGKNGVTFFVIYAPANFCVHWYRILGTEAYALSTNESSDFAFPTDRFIGSGERVFTVTKQDPPPGENPIEGVHIARYRVWLKGVS